EMAVDEIVPSSRPSTMVAIARIDFRVPDPLEKPHRQRNDRDVRAMATIVEGLELGNDLVHRHFHGALVIRLFGDFVDLSLRERRRRALLNFEPASIWALIAQSRERRMHVGVLL